MFDLNSVAACFDQSDAHQLALVYDRRIFLGTFERRFRHRRYNFLLRGRKVRIIVNPG
jgi:hypothetical protein